MALIKFMKIKSDVNMKFILSDKKKCIYFCGWLIYKNKEKKKKKLDEK